MSTLATDNVEQLQARVAELEQQLATGLGGVSTADGAKREFLSNMSHEIRTPLNAVLGFTRLLANERLTSEQHEKVRHIGHSAHALLELIDDIITLAKVESGVLRPYLSWFDLAPVLRESIDHCTSSALLKGLRVEYAFDDSIPGVLRGDRARLRQVLVNLLGNAVKFTDEGCVTLRVGVEQETLTEVVLRFEVEDTGPGIDMERIDRLFAMFTQGDGSATRPHGGTGVGLALCRRLVDLLEGELGCRCREAGGSVFWFTMKFDKHEQNKQAVIEPKPAAASDTVSMQQLNAARSSRTRETGTRILVVDDDRLCRVLMGDMLLSYGSCEFAESGADALAKVSQALESQTPYNLICLDIMMPGMDGHTTLKEIRRLEEQHGIGGGDASKVIMTTALRESHHCMHAFKAGCEAYLTKPVEQAKLIHAIQELGVVQ